MLHPKPPNRKSFIMVRVLQEALDPGLVELDEVFIMIIHENINLSFFDLLYFRLMLSAIGRYHNHLIAWKTMSLKPLFGPFYWYHSGCDVSHWLED